MHLESMMGSVVLRTNLTSAPQNNEEKREDGDAEVEAVLDSKEIEFLESIIEKPNFGVLQRRDYLGLSSHDNNEMKKSLVAEGLIAEFSVNFGRATKGNVRFQQLLEKGYKALKKTPPKGRVTNCSEEHWFWQKNIAEFYKEEGYEVEIEKDLNGKKADVGFVKEGKNIAIEVGITPKNEVYNVQKDLEVGFYSVLVACKNMKVKEAVEKRLKENLSEEELRKVKVILLFEFSFVKKILGEK